MLRSFFVHTNLLSSLYQMKMEKRDNLVQKDEKKGNKISDLWKGLARKVGSC
ncbi:hypothetical protein LEP1GSC017_2808 [Leptospira meyeri serovar Hardjo str. Went 5]|nr:hypothetical protein LEP1GSC017_2808 [Leptospira meyeri serovar Hardjo str. Went 5]